MKTLTLILEVSDHLEEESITLLDAIQPTATYPLLGDRIIALIRAGLRMRERHRLGRVQRKKRGRS